MNTAARVARRSGLALFGSFALVALLGCSSVRGRADDALAKGDYARAAELYAQAVAKDANDEEARSGLLATRTRILLGFVAEAERARAAGKTGEALGYVEGLLRKRESFGQRFDTTTERKQEELVAWAEKVVREDVLRFVEGGTPLLAERSLAAKQSLLAQAAFAALRTELEAKTQASGRAECAKRVAASFAGRPYLLALVRTYCEHFGAAVQTTGVLPHALSRIELSGSVLGQSEGQRARLATALNDALRNSLWFDERSPRTALASLSGSQNVAFARREVTLDKPWVEHVPYQSWESVLVPYQEPYVMTEFYTVSIPYTSVQTFSRPCGTGGGVCTDARPVTHFRTETRPRLVTRYRTAFRSETRPVTRIRDVPRVFVLHATEASGTYKTDWTIHLSLGEGLLPMVLRREADVTQKEHEHDVTFEPAFVRPSHPRLTTEGEWFERQLKELESTYASAGVEHYRVLFCKSAAYDVETAARCARAPGATYPEEVKSALASVFGHEVGEVLALRR